MPSPNAFHAAVLLLWYSATALGYKCKEFAGGSASSYRGMAIRCGENLSTGTYLGNMSSPSFTDCADYCLTNATCEAVEWTTKDSGTCRVWAAEAQKMQSNPGWVTGVKVSYYEVTAPPSDEVPACAEAAKTINWGYYLSCDTSPINLISLSISETHLKDYKQCALFCQGYGESDGFAFGQAGALFNCRCLYSRTTGFLSGAYDIAIKHHGLRSNNKLPVPKDVCPCWETIYE